MQFHSSFTYLHTDLLSLWSGVLLEKLTGSQLVKKYSALYGTPRLITGRTVILTLFVWSCDIKYVHNINCQFYQQSDLLQSRQPGFKTWQGTGSVLFVIMFKQFLVLPCLSSGQQEVTFSQVKNVESFASITLCFPHIVLRHRYGSTFIELDSLYDTLAFA